MYKDVISYQLADGVTEEQLLKIAEQIVKDWMKKQDGFVKWEIHHNSDGGLTDIVYWRSKEDAKKAEQDMANIPNAGDWYGCYKEGSVSSNNLMSIDIFE